MQPMPMSMLKNLAVWEDLIYYQCAGDYRLIGQDKKIDTNQFFAKTFGELVALEKFFDYLNRNNKYDRLFKLSGRYALTEIWNRAHYDNKDVVVRSPWFWSRSPKDPSTKGGTYSTKFWSWHHDTSPVVYEMIRDMFDQTIAMFRERGEIVILEHQLYLGIQKYHLPCRELSVLGIQGYYGQNGHFVCE
jgi:hypothetical protein